MNRKGIVLIMMIIVGVMMMAQLKAAGPSNEQRRTQALRLYQEGLFHEMGTGDLELAFKIYAELATTYDNIPDVAAVAYYHMGILLDKSGEYEKAISYFNLVLKKYSEQHHVIKRIKLKLREMEANHKLLRKKAVKISKSSKQLTASPSRSKIVVKQVQEPAVKRWGLGLHTTGIHGRYMFGSKDKSALEVNLNFQDDQLTLGGRLLFMSAFNLSDSLFVNIYPGLAIYQELNQSIDATFEAGGLIGSEIILNRTWGLGADIGYYYVQSENEKIKTSIKGYAYLTVYF